MEPSKVVSVTRVTPEEAQAFRDRVRKQNEEMAKWVITPIDEVIEFIETVIAGHQDWTSCQMYGHNYVDDHCTDCSEVRENDEDPIREDWR